MIERIGNKICVNRSGKTLLSFCCIFFICKNGETRCCEEKRGRTLKKRGKGRKKDESPILFVRVFVEEREIL